MSKTKSSGSSPRSTSSRNATFGWTQLTTIGARSSSPDVERRHRPPGPPRRGCVAPGPRCGSRTRTTSGGVAHRTGDRAHATLGETPVHGVALPASDAADRVVQQHVGGARFVGARPLPDQAVDHHDRLHLLGLEPSVEQLGEAHREQPRGVGDPAGAELPHRPRGLRLRQQVAEVIDPTLRRDLVQQRPDHLGDAVHPRLVGGQRLGVLGGELRDRTRTSWPRRRRRS